MRRLIAALGFAALALAACDADQPDIAEPTPRESPSPSPSPTAGQLPDGWALCTDDRDGYAIGYPEEWHAEAPGLRDECSLFDPEPFEVERGTEAPLVAMTVNDQEVPFSEGRTRIVDEERQRALERSSTTVGGHAAIRFETVQTEALLYPEGTRRYGYLLDDGGTAFFVSTVSVPGTEMNYQRNKEIVDDAARTVDFDV